MKRRILTTALVMTMVMGLASPAIAKSPEANLKTKKTATIVAGDSAWLAINWEGKSGDITEFRVTAQAPSGIEVAYPDNTPGFTGLMNGHVLSEKEIDFTALKVSVPYEQTRKFTIMLTATYQSEGQSVKETFEVTVPVAAYEADQDLVQVTESAGSIPAGEAGWIAVDYTGIAPTVEHFELMVSDPAGLAVAYPLGKLSTSLYFNDELEDHETDYAAILVDTAGVAPGTYTMSLRVTYQLAGQSKTLDGTLTLTVAG